MNSEQKDRLLVRLRFTVHCLLLGAMGLMVIFALLPKTTLYPPGTTFSQSVLDRHGQPLRLTLSEDDKYRIFTPLGRISQKLKDSTLLHEDRHFYRHPGINPFAVTRSAWGLLTRKGRRTGGSTVTMQLARMRFGINSRSIFGKLHQMGRALQLERHFSKDEIFEAYLNLAPYGGNLEGIGAATCLYLGKSPAEISRREAVALSVIPQSPARRTPPRGVRENAHLAEAQSRLFSRIRDSEGLVADPLDGHFTVRQPRNRPFAAPHLARRLLKVDSESSEIKTTIDLKLQRILEDSMSAYRERRGETGVSNAAALMIDHRSMEVMAYLGSADFWDVKIQGQVDGIQMRRSPGSTLKPFVYALALQQGIIHPNSLLKDAKLSFGDYTPENFDRGYSGPLTASQALQRSRNIPAVALTNLLRKPRLYEFLKSGGIQLPEKESHYGLTLSLGGAEVSLEELVRLYAVMPNRGMLQELSFQKDRESEVDSTPRRILTPEAAFLALTMIKDIPAPGLSRRLGTSAAQPVYWKTGTSHGFRDAWAVAIFDSYVLGVWVGDFRGKSNASYVARDATAPLIFDMIGAIRAEHPDSPSYLARPAGENLKRVQLCPTSGQQPTKHCPSHRSGWIIPGVSPIHHCAVHREVAIDLETGLRLAKKDDDGNREVRREVYEFWPSDMRNLFRDAGIAMRQPPPFFSEGGNPLVRAASGPLKIVSPMPNTVYTLQAGRTEIPLKVASAADAQRVFWFAGRELIGSEEPGEELIWESARPGTYTLRAVDDRGRSGERRVTFRAGSGVGEP